MTSFIVKPNELVREQPYISHNIQFTRQAFNLDQVAQHEFPAEITVEAADAANNQATLQNIRLWDWHALQDTLRQIQEIRTYYDFPDIDIDRYQINGEERQVMLAARELNVEKAAREQPQLDQREAHLHARLRHHHESGKRVHARGPAHLLLSNMPIQSTVPSIQVKRPEIYFGQLTNTDVYVKTRQKEFDYPQGETNSMTTYEGTAASSWDGFLRRAPDRLRSRRPHQAPLQRRHQRAESRLLMRRNVLDRVKALAPFLTFDSDPYIVVGDDGRLSWMLDAFTTSDSYPYSTHYTLGNDQINYMRNSVKVVIDAYNGTCNVSTSSIPAIRSSRPIATSFLSCSKMPRLCPPIFAGMCAIPSCCCACRPLHTASIT